MARLSRSLRDLVLRGTFLVTLVALACVAPSSPRGTLAPPAAAPRERDSASAREGSREDVEADLVAAHNRIRREHHLAPLRENGPLAAAAREHAQDMARHHWMAHRGSDLSSPFRRMTNQGYVFRRAAENVAAGYPTVDAVMNGWMRSPGHRWNILGKFSEIGTACATASDGTPYWCVTFGDPAGNELGSPRTFMGYPSNEPGPELP